MAAYSRNSAADLARHPLLAGADPGLVAGLAARARWIDATPEQIVLDFEDRTTDVYLILQGNVRVLVRSADGERTQILGDFGPGELVGEMSAIDDTPRSAMVEALVRTRLCALPAASFLDAAFSSRLVGLRLLRLLTARVREQNGRLFEHAALPTRLRLAAELLRLARPRPDGTRALSPPPTQEELAARIGTRRETVSRELATLARAGMLARTRGALVLSDPAALQGMVDGGLDRSDPGLSHLAQDGSCELVGPTGALPFASD